MAALEPLARIWGDRVGYVFLPWIAGGTSKEDRRTAYREGPAFRWPLDRDRIQEHIRAHTGDDLYFTPALFNRPQRVEQNVDDEQTLWADLDPVDPRGIDPELRPTVAWETSPGRYQGVWLLSTPRVGASWYGRENHRLTQYLGADPSGWDGTQLLRVPGSIHYKGDPQPGKLLWMDGPTYSWGDFDRLPALPPPAGTDLEAEALDDQLVSEVDTHQVWARVRLMVSSRVRQLMAATSTGGEDRSSILWEIERELADAGCTLAEIVALVRPTPWNKYAGRGDEFKRLKSEAAKAKAQVPIESVAPLALPTTFNWATDLASQSLRRPSWLIKNIWTRGGCGFIAGPPKSYKSWVALDLAVSVATGLPFLGQYRVVQPGPVLYLQEEDSQRLVVERLSMVTESRSPRSHWQGYLESPQESTSTVLWHPAGDLPIDLQIQTGFVASDPQWQSWLGARLEAMPYRLVIVDTLTTSAGAVDLDKALDLQNRILKPLRTLAQQHDVALVVVHHNKKQAGHERSGGNMLGSVALHGWVDCALYLEAKDQDNLVQITPEAKEDPTPRFRIRIPRMFQNWTTGERQLWAPELDHSLELEAPNPEPPKPRDPAGSRVAWKVKQMGGGPFTMDQLLQRVGRKSAPQVMSALSNQLLTQDSTGLIRLGPQYEDRNA